MKRWLLINTEFPNDDCFKSLEQCDLLQKKDIYVLLIFGSCHEMTCRKQVPLRIYSCNIPQSMKSVSMSFSFPMQWSSFLAILVTACHYCEVKWSQSNTINRIMTKTYAHVNNRVNRSSQVAAGLWGYWGSAYSWRQTIYSLWAFSPLFEFC